MSVRLTVAIPANVYRQLVSAARVSCQPVSVFAREILESDVASRRLSVLPPIPKKGGGRPDIFDRLNLR
jgi:hypothetical protein